MRTWLAVDRAGAGATKNRLDPRLGRCRVLGQTDRTAIGPAIAAVFDQLSSEFGDNGDLSLKYLQTTAIELLGRATLWGAFALLLSDG